MYLQSGPYKKPKVKNKCVQLRLKTGLQFIPIINRTRTFEIAVAYGIIEKESPTSRFPKWHTQNWHTTVTVTAGKRLRYFVLFLKSRVFIKTLFLVKKDLNLKSVILAGFVSRLIWGRQNQFKVSIHIETKLGLSSSYFSLLCLQTELRNWKLAY